MHIRAEFSDFEPGWNDQEYLVDAKIPAQLVELEVKEEKSVDNAVAATEAIAAVSLGTNIILSGAMS